MTFKRRAIWLRSCQQDGCNRLSLLAVVPNKKGGVTNPSNAEPGWTGSRLPPELPVMLAAHPNVLIVANEQKQSAAVEALTPYLRQPVIVMRSGFESSLPLRGSVIVPSIGDLTLQAQEALFNWLEDRGRDTQLVSLSAVSLFPLVSVGKFLEDLYYRINIVQFEADESVLS
jgi:hypothetical protein